MKKLIPIIYVNITLLACNPIQKDSLKRQETLNDSIEEIKSNLKKLDKSEISMFTRHQENIEEANRSLDSIRQLRKSWRLRLDGLKKEYDKL